MTIIVGLVIIRVEETLRSNTRKNNDSLWLLDFKCCWEREELVVNNPCWVIK